MKQLKIFKYIILFNLITFSVSAQFIHPGLSHKKSDLERMKYMVEAQIDPWYSSFQRLRNERSAQYNYQKEGDPSFTDVNNSGYRNEFERDSRAAYANALMWNITGDERHAQKSVEILNTWQNITDVSDFALEAGIAWVMIEAAEMIKHTYDGWEQSDIQKFGDMLVHPGYSNTQIPSSLRGNNDSFYWRSYQGEPFRAGNQGLSAWRTVMAIGVFLDNEIIYDRAYRHLTGQPHRSDDFAYPSGPYDITGSNGSSRYRESYNVNSRSGNQEDYGFNGVLTNYIYENGQCEESSRDQGHTVFGIGVINAMAEIGWTQGDDIYGHADSRLLKGLEYTLKYNVSFIRSYPDQQSSWEPTVASGEFLAIFDRTERTKHLEICPFFPNNFDRLSRGTFIGQGTFELPVAHYIGRGIATNNEALWTERARDVFIEENGRTENFDGGTTAYGGYGGLTYRRPHLCYGDPIAGFSEDLPDYKMNVLPSTIEAVNFDYSPINGEGRTYHDNEAGNRGGQYRLDEDVDIQECSEGGYALGLMEPGEWLTYTVYVPKTGTYDLSIRYAANSANGTIKFSLGGEDKTGEVALPSSNGWDNWGDYSIAETILLKQGVQSLRVQVGGTEASFNLKNITIGVSDLCVKSETGLEDYLEPGIKYNYYEGVWDNLPDFETLTVLNNGVTSDIGLGNGEIADGYGYVFDGFVYLDAAGDYTFYTSSDDGSNLSIDGVEIVNNDGVHGTNEESGSICLQAGYHKIRVEYFEKEGTRDVLDVAYEGPGISKQSITNLYYLNESVLSVDSFENVFSKVNIYPNPISTSATIDQAADSTIVIYNMSGSVVFVKSILNQSEEVDLSKLITGVYYAEISNDAHKSVIKLVKE